MKQKTYWLALLFFIFVTTIYASSGQKYSQIGNLKLVSGECINDCKIGYRTFGKLSAAKDNIVIFPTWFSGTSEHIETLIKKSLIIDTTKYFVIAIDALANGVSTSPSNSSNQSNEKFPAITVEDMVISEFRMLENEFNFSKVYGLLGGSMGSMQVLQWSVTYPNYAEKVIGYVCSPKMSAYDLINMNLQKEIIETGHKYNLPEKEIKKQLAIWTAIQAKSPEAFNQDHSTDEFAKYYSTFEKEPSKTYTSYDYLTQLNAMIMHDIFAKTGSIDKTISEIKSKLFLIAADSDHLVNDKYAKILAEKGNYKILMLQNNCGHMSVNCDMENVKKAIDEFLKK